MRLTYFFIMVNISREYHIEIIIIFHSMDMISKKNDNEIFYICSLP